MKITVPSGYITGMTLRAPAAEALTAATSAASADAGLSFPASLENGLDVSVPMSTPPGRWANGDGGTFEATCIGIVYQVTCSCAGNYVASVGNFQGPAAPSLDADAAASLN